MQLKENNINTIDSIKEEVGNQPNFLLLEKLKKLEDDILPDNLVEKALLQSGENLKRIYGENGVYDQHIQKQKDNGKDETDIIKSKYKKVEKPYVGVVNADSQWTTDVSLYKNSVLSDFLVEKGLLPRKELNNLHNIFGKYSGNVSGIEKDQNTSTELEYYVSILEKNKEFLIKERDDILFNQKNTWSVTNLLGHEIAHNLFNDFNAMPDIQSIHGGVDEAFSFGLQQSIYLYDESTKIDKTNLKKHINDLYRLIIDRQYGYGKEQYSFMKSFIPIVAGLFITSAIGLKNNDKRNQLLVNKAYKSKNVGEIFSFYDEAIKNIGDDELTSIFSSIKETSIKKLNDCKNLINLACDDEIKNIENIDGKKCLDFMKGLSYKKPWKSLDEASQQIFVIIGRFFNKLSILQILGDKELFDKKRDSFLTKLNITLEKIMEHAENKENNKAISQQILEKLTK